MSIEQRESAAWRHAEASGAASYGTEAPNPYDERDPLHHAWQRGLYAAERRQNPNEGDHDGLRS